MIPSAANSDYPKFVADQVLTSDNLNDLFGYLDEQGRMTRTNLSGIGIVCGLKVKTAADGSSITITKGVGVTSSGYLVTVPEITYTKRTSAIFNAVKSEYYNRFVNIASKTQKFDLWELKQEAEAEGSTALTKTFLSSGEKIVLMFVELLEENNKNCDPNSCDDKGIRVTVNFRPLLIKKDDADKIMEDSTLVKFRESVISFQEVPLPGISFSKPEFIQNFEKTYLNYFKAPIEKNVISRLAEALKSANSCLINLVPDLKTPDWDLLLNAVFDAPAKLNQIQYYYDFLKDLTLAYHELRDAMVDQISICVHGRDEFPRHLWLGSSVDTNQARYRTGFFPSPAVTEYDKSLEHILYLFDRIDSMISGFKVPQTEVEFEITPSIWGSKYLSGRSLPFYYLPELRPKWDARRKDATSSLSLLSYHDDSRSPDHVRNPLNYDFESYNFFRFEGLIGKSILKFSVEYSKIVPVPVSLLYLDVDKIGSFLDKHPAISHEAGALRGGTFVVLYRGNVTNLILADFSLPYRIEDRVESGCLCRVLIKECEFEWFDTPRHLGNLAMREYRFGSRPAVHLGVKLRQSNEQEKVKLADFYVIRIYKYDIQGHSLIGSTPTDVYVPIAELKSGRLSAIARHLNSTFKNGVIFDYKPDTNKIIIRYFSDQNFRIEWGGLQGNQLRYAYEPGSISLWQNEKWQPLDSTSKYKVECHLRNEYRPEEYHWLQEDAYFEAKYPTTAPMPDVADLIQWEKLIGKRSKLKLPIKPLLDQIEHWASESMTGGSEIHIVLIGSWANGSWISRNPVENRFPPNFLTLLHKIHGRGNVPSDIDLLINMDESYSPSSVKESIQSILSENNSAYKINILYGKKDSQKGIQLI